MSGWIGTALGRVCLLALALASSQCGEDSSAARTIGAQQDNESSTNGPGSEVVATDPALLPAGAEPTGSTPTRTNEQLNPSGLAETPSSAAADAGAGAMAPAVAGDRCDVGVYDAANPPRSLALSGSLGAHDPVILAAGGSYHYFSTGNGISVKTSPDLLRWTQGAAVFASIPAWFQQLVPEYAPRSIWAPDISYFGGQYHLYYSVSSFGSNRSCIGHATRADLDTGEWTDHEAMFCSNQPGQDDNYNAIDPNLVLDEAGTAWLAFGSFWSGIKLLRLDQNGERAGTELYSLASRGGGAIEGPFIVRRCGFYYLFVSFDACCRGVFRVSKRRAAIVLYILAVWFVISFVTNIIGPLMPTIIGDFGLNLALAGLLPFSFFLAYGVVSIPAGIAVEKYGAKRALLGAFALNLVGALGIAFFPNYAIVIGALFVIGIGMAMLQVVINPLMRTAGGEAHFAFYSVMGQLVFGLASFLSPFVFSALMQRASDPSAQDGVSAALLRLSPAALPWVSFYWAFSAIFVALIA